MSLLYWYVKCIILMMKILILRLTTSTFLLRPNKHQGTMIVDLSDFVENGSLEIKEHLCTYF